MLPTISVILPTYNRAHTLRRAIDSVLSQTVHDVELLVCDDGSTDDTAAMVAALAAVDSRIRWLPGVHTGLPAFPRNRGLASARGTWLAFIDSDDCWRGNKLEQQLGRLRESGYRACCTNAFRQVAPGVTGERYQELKPDTICFRELCALNTIVTSSVLFHRALLPIVTGFPELEALRGCGEDYALWLRIASLTPFAYIDTPLLDYLMDAPDSVRLARNMGIPSFLIVIFRDFGEWARQHKTDIAKKDYLLARAWYRKNRMVVLKRHIRGAIDALSGGHPSGGKSGCKPASRMGRAVAYLKKKTGRGVTPGQMPPANDGMQAEKVAASLSALMRARTGADDGRAEKGLSCLLFSRDRAMQLEGLLRSMETHCDPFPAVKILCKATDPRHRQSYDEVLRAYRHLPVTLQAEVDFREDLRLLIRSIATKRMFFLVDDIIFIRPCNFSRLDPLDRSTTIFSMRLGRNLSRCGIQDRQQDLPPLKPCPGAPEVYRWIWNEGQFDWGYPLSVDGNIFATAEVEAMADTLDYRSPNTLELSMQTLRNQFAGMQGACFELSCIVNVPANRVQNDVQNPCGDSSAREMLEKWQQGYRIAVERTYGMLNTSVHEDVILEYVKNQAAAPVLCVPDAALPINALRKENR